MRRFYLPLVLTILLLGGTERTGKAQPLPSPAPIPPWPESYLRRTGEVRVPVLLVRFDGSSEPFTPAELEQALFKETGASSTLTDYYKETSYGQFVLRGDIHTWVGVPEDHDYYHGGPQCYGTCRQGQKRIRELIEEVVSKNRNAGVDFSDYDNDGPDGKPNSGDDDGFVDLLLVVFSDRSGQCLIAGGGSTEGIIAHHQQFYNLFQTGSHVLDTGSMGHGGQKIYVNDYLIVPGQNCDRSGLNPIGYYAHEIGHALGLPDLVDQDSSSGGIGFWSLMAEGGAGADGDSPEMPTHLSAWAKERLGWLRPRMITAAGDYQLRPVETHPEAFRIPFLDGATRQYYLLEARSHTGFNSNLPGVGLLVWRINATAVEEWYFARRKNTDLASINDEDTRKGVVLIEADGRNDLTAQSWMEVCKCLALPGCNDTCGVCCGGGGDDGDPFPGNTNIQEFDSFSKARSFGDVALCDIKLVGDKVHFSLKTEGDCK